MKIEINNQQNLRKPEKEAILNLTAWLLQKTVKLNPELDYRELSLVLMDDPGIAEVNREFLDHEGPTDVISFRYAPSFPGDHYSAEVFVNVEQAIRLGPDYKGIQHELAFYIAHGIDHLNGSDDATDKQRQEMHTRELSWLEDAENQGLLLMLIEESSTHA